MYKGFLLYIRSPTHCKHCYKQFVVSSAPRPADIVSSAFTHRASVHVSTDSRVKWRKLLLLTFVFSEEGQ